MKTMLEKTILVIAVIEDIILFPIDIVAYGIFVILWCFEPWHVIAYCLTEYVWIKGGWYLKFNGITKEDLHQCVYDDQLGFNK